MKEIHLLDLEKGALISEPAGREFKPLSQNAVWPSRFFFMGLAQGFTFPGILSRDLKGKSFAGLVRLAGPYLKDRSLG